MLPVMILTAVGWIYVVALMSLSETSFVAGIMTFLLYGVLPLSIILYLFDAPRRRRNSRDQLQKQIEEREAAEKKRLENERKERDAKSSNGGTNAGTNPGDAAAAIGAVTGGTGDLPDD